MPRAPSILLLPEPALSGDMLCDELELKMEEEIEIEDKRNFSENELTIDFNILKEYINSNSNFIKEDDCRRLNAHQFNDSRIMLYSIDNDATYSDSLKTIGFNYWKQALATSFWLDIVNVNSQELSMLKQLFHLDINTIEDIYMHNNKEKLDLFDNYKFLSYLTAAQDGKIISDILECEVDAASIYTIITSRGIITLSKTFLPSRQRIIERIKSLEIKIQLPYWMCFSVLDSIIQNIDLILKKSMEQVELIEENILGEIEIDLKIQSTTIKQLNLLKHVMFNISKLLSHKQHLCFSLKNHINESTIMLYFDDIKDHIHTMNLTCFQIEKSITRIQANYLSSLTLKHIQSNNSTFDQSMFLTYAGAILSIFLLTTGIWGMNINVLGRTKDGEGVSTDENTLIWFYSILAGSLFLSVLFGALLHWYSKRSSK